MIVAWLNFSNEIGKNEVMPETIDAPSILKLKVFI
jgi:hypothetical protein